MQAILAKGVPRTKLVVGVPFYGRGWRGIESEKGWTEGSSTIQIGGYRAIATNQLQSAGFVRHWDDVAKVPWLYNAETKEWITYEDAQSMRIKGSYVVEQGLAARCSGSCRTTMGRCWMRCEPGWAGQDPLEATERTKRDSKRRNGVNGDERRETRATRHSARRYVG